MTPYFIHDFYTVSYFETLVHIMVEYQSSVIFSWGALRVAYQTLSSFLWEGLNDGPWVEGDFAVDTIFGYRHVCVLEKNAKSLLRLRTVCCFFWDMNHKWMVVFFSKREKCERKRQTDLTEMSSAGKKCCFVEVFQLFVASYRKKSSVDWEVFVSTKKSLIFEWNIFFLFFNFFFYWNWGKTQRNTCQPRITKKQLFLLPFFST